MQCSNCIATDCIAYDCIATDCIADDCTATDCIATVFSDKFNWRGDPGVVTANVMEWSTGEDMLRIFASHL